MRPFICRYDATVRKSLAIRCPLKITRREGRLIPAANVAVAYVNKTESVDTVKALSIPLS